MLTHKKATARREVIRSGAFDNACRMEFPGPRALEHKAHAAAVAITLLTQLRDAAKFGPLIALDIQSAIDGFKEGAHIEEYRNRTGLVCYKVSEGE